MAWQIISGVNEGYPVYVDDDGNNVIPSLVKFYKPYPTLAWRIKSGHNNGYPFIWYWDQYDESEEKPDDDDEDEDEDEDKPDEDPKVEKGGTTKIYPDLTDYGKSEMNVDDEDQAAKVDEPTSVPALVAGTAGLGTYVCSLSTLSDFQNNFSTHIISNTAYHTLIQQVFGANVYNAVLSAKVFPVDIPTVGGISEVNVYGGLTIYDKEGFYYPAACAWKGDFGSVDLNITYAYELEDCDFYIYLPFCGLYSIPVVGNESLHLQAAIDFISGQLTYYLYSNEQLIFTTSGCCCYEAPMNFQGMQYIEQGIVKSTSIMTKAAGTGAMMLGAGDLAPINQVIPPAKPGDPTTFFGMGGMVSNILDRQITERSTPYAAQQILGGKMLNNAASAITTSPISINSTFSGGLVNFMMPFTPRIYCRRPKLINEGHGIQQVIGLNKQKVYDGLSTVKGHTKFTNYTCNVANATETEKKEIEQIMNSGVILPS